MVLRLLANHWVWVPPTHYTNLERLQKQEKHTHTHWKMKSYIIYTFIFNGTKWFRNELCTPTRLQFMRSTEMKFKILLSLFSRLSSYCQRFYPVSSAAIAKGHKYNTRTLIHTKTHSIILLVSFIYFMTVVALGNHIASDAIYVIGQRFLLLVAFYFPSNFPLSDVSYFLTKMRRKKNISLETERRAVA